MVDHLQVFDYCNYNYKHRVEKRCFLYYNNKQQENIAIKGDTMQNNEKTKNKTTEKILHFGVLIKKSQNNLISRDNYATIDKRNSRWEPQKVKFWKEVYKTPEELHKRFEDDECKFHSDVWCEKHRIACLTNYDLNMSFFEKIDPKAFNKALSKLLKSSKRIHEVFDLNEHQEKSGIYIMVLDNYKQIYIGQATNLKKRILQHWSKNKEFDRLLHGKVENSVLSIDSFGALDTTRIFVLECATWELDDKEQLLVNKISNNYKLNRIDAGRCYDEIDMFAKTIASNKRNLSNT